MIELEGGEFIQGTNDTSDALFDESDGESPSRYVHVDGFSISKYATTRRQFELFVEETGYKTDAEKYGWSFCFENLMSNEQLEKCEDVAYFAPWWVKVDGADWRHPYGPISSKSKVIPDDHPVTQMSYTDAVAFCSWALPNGRLPTEAEWEFAARGSLEGARYPWGNEMNPKGKHKMNIWQSVIPKSQLPTKNFYLNGEYYLDPDQKFLSITPPSDPNQLEGPSYHYAPATTNDDDDHLVVELEGMEKVMASIQVTSAFYAAGNSENDGYVGTCPVDAYGPQNDFGLFNVVGNVWEWTADWWTTERSPLKQRNPTGPLVGDKKVLKGGSFLCNWLTCPRMRPSGRKGLPPDSGSDVLGFRCASST